jgi:hypothetical protein
MEVAEASMRKTIFLSMALAMVLAGCGRVQEIQNTCDGDLECPACTTDNQCVIVSNACHETAACVHRDVELSVNQIGCSDALAYEVPDDAVCTCQASVCKGASAAP